jgi:DNA-binding GntR family transcriptional regulator
VREALHALENEGTLFAAPYTGAMVRPLSATGAREIAELRLALISLAVKLAHPQLAPTHFDLAYDLAKRIQEQEARAALPVVREWERRCREVLERGYGSEIRPVSIRPSPFGPGGNFGSSIW